MRSLLITILFFVVFLLNNINPIKANPYVDPDNDLSYPINYVDEMLQAVNGDVGDGDVEGRSGTEKRACIRRGGNCDHRPNDCCYNSSCRCNLWGSNCRCQRMGLFQKWG